MHKKLLQHTLWGICAMVGLPLNMAAQTSSVSDTDAQALATEANAFLARTVGYPGPQASVRTTLAQEIKTYTAKTTWTATDTAALGGKLRAFRSSTADIVYPLSGQAYTVRAKGREGETNQPYYLYDSPDNTSNLQLSKTLDEATKDNFYFRLIAGNAAGQYSLKNVGTDRYLNKKLGSATEELTQLAAVGDGAFSIKPLTSNYYIAWSSNKIDQWGNRAGKLIQTSWELTPVDYAFDKQLLVIQTEPASISANYTWNGMEAGARGLFEVAANATIADGTLGAKSTDGTFRFVNFTNAAGETVTSVTQPISQVLTAHFRNNIFSSTYGEKWVQLKLGRDGAYTWRLPAGTSYEGMVLKNLTGEVKDDRNLWCLVGSANDFKIYNKAAGQAFAVTTDANPGNGATVRLTAAANAVSWVLNSNYTSVSDGPGYGLTVKGSNGNVSPNAFGGKGGEVKCYTLADGGSHWNFNLVYDVSIKMVTFRTNPAVAQGEFTWNGNSVTNGGTIGLEIGAVPTEATLVGRSTDAAYAFTGFTNAAGVAVTSLSSLTQDTTLVAQFSPAFFSTKYGEKWVRLTFARNGGYAIQLAEGENFNGLGANNLSLDVSNERSMWCLVGTAAGFKLYNKVAGEDFALHTSAQAASGTALTMVPQADASEWVLSNQYLTAGDGPGYALTVKGSTTKLSPNSFGGLGGPIKLYSEADGGGHWNLMDASVTMTLDVKANNAPTTLLETQRYAAQADLTLGNKTSRLFMKPGDHMTLYLPAGSSMGLKIKKSYRNYRFENYLDGTNASPTLELPILKENKALTAQFTFADSLSHYIYYSPDAAGIPFRIPAITAAPNGDIFAVSDYRFAKADIGFGDLDIVARRSKDNGRSWGPSFTILQHVSSERNTTFGDAAIVADREQNKILMMSCAGRRFFSYSTVDDPLRMVRTEANYDAETDTWTWSEPKDMTDYMYKSLFKSQINALFIGAGKLMQSRVTKVGEYYRLYAALTTVKEGNRVIYSDDFGHTWAILGGIDARPAPSGNEPKCEELPDGSVVLTARAGGTRYFNIFTFDKTADAIKEAKGRWTGVTGGLRTGDSGTNGEILLLHATRKSDNERVLLALHSIPTNSRTNVSIFYKEIDPNEKQASKSFADGWKQKQVSHSTSAYSTMDLQADGRIGFFMEENYDGGGGYDMVYVPFTLDSITAGAYTLDASIDLSEAGVSTLYTNYPVQLGKDLQAASLVLSKTGDALEAIPHKSNCIAPLQGVLLQGNKGVHTYRQSRTIVPIVGQNLLTGTVEGNKLTPTGTDSVYYALSTTQEDRPAFAVPQPFEGVQPAFTLVPYTAYLRVSPTQTKVQTLPIGTTNSIATMLLGGEKDGKIFDLTGRQVTQVEAKGIYIVNGKKVMMPRP